MNSVSNIRYKRPRSDDPYLEYESIAHYSNKMASFIIPFDNLNLCKHLTEYSKFIDALYNEDNVLMKLKGTVSKVHDHLWFLKLGMDLEEEEDEIVMEVERNGGGAPYDDICNLSWEWHNNIKSRESPFTSLYAINYFLSWGSFCRVYYLNIMLIDTKGCSQELLSRTASDYKFTEMVDETHYIIVHDQPIMQYSIQFIFHAIKVVLPVLYTYSYSTEMRDYIYHLFLRYCSIISVACEDEDEEDMILDHPSHYISHNTSTTTANNEEVEESGTSGLMQDEDFNAFKKTCIPMNSRYSITSKYIYLGETLFYSQLARINLSLRLVNASQKSPIKFHEYGTLKESVLLIKLCLDAWHKFICKVAIHPEIRTTIKECFHTDSMHLFLYHGEKAHYKRECPESNHEPGDIISETRSDDFTALQSVRKIVIKDISTLFYKGYIQFLNEIVTTASNGDHDDDRDSIPSFNERNAYTPKTVSYPSNVHTSVGNDSGNHHHVDLRSNGVSLNVPYLDHEKECVLATKVCTLNWFRYNRVESWKVINESFIIEELCDTMTPIDNIFIDHQRVRSYNIKHPAYLVRLMRIYYVIDINQKVMEIYQTDVFPKAYSLWLCLLLKYSYIKESILHPEIKDTVRMMYNKLV
jgi:hypothetical protein